MFIVNYNTKMHKSLVKEPRLLVKHFNDIDITIYTTHEKQFFKLDNVCKVLDINENVIDDFDDKCKVQIKDNGWFVTEYGLFKLLFMSNNKVAKEFQQWVIKIIKALRLYWSEDLEEQEEEPQKVYEEIQKTGCIYIVKINDVIYIRKTEKLELKLDKNEELVFKFETSNPDLLALCVRSILEEQKSIVKSDTSKCTVEHIKNMITIVGHMIDTLKSSYQHIAPDDLMRKLNEKWQA
jgi:hypothetical protein